MDYPAGLSSMESLDQVNKTIKIVNLIMNQIELIFFTWDLLLFSSLNFVIHRVTNRFPQTVIGFAF